MKSTTIQLTKRQHTLLDDEKEKTGCSIGSIMRNALELYFKQREEN